MIRRGLPDQVALGFARDAALIVCDRGYLKPQRAWRASVARQATCRVVQIEGDVLVPVETVSPKHEFGRLHAAPKAVSSTRKRPIVPLEASARARAQPPNSPRRFPFDLTDVPGLARSLEVDQTVAPVQRFRGGTSQAWARLERFLDEPFARYAKNRSMPEAGAASHMSPYLHFGTHPRKDAG